MMKVANFNLQYSKTSKYLETPRHQLYEYSWLNSHSCCLEKFQLPHTVVVSTNSVRKEDLYDTESDQLLEI